MQGRETTQVTLNKKQSFNLTHGISWIPRARTSGWPLEELKPGLSLPFWYFMKFNLSLMHTHTQRLPHSLYSTSNFDTRNSIIYVWKYSICPGKNPRKTKIVLCSNVSLHHATSHRWFHNQEPIQGVGHKIRHNSHCWDNGERETQKYRKRIVGLQI